MLAAGSLQAAVITVTTTDDAALTTTTGECTLRAAVASANENTIYDGCAAGELGADQIEFDGSLAYSTITLTEGEIDITEALTITGPVADDPAGITIDGNDASRIFYILGSAPSAFAVGLDSVTLTGGHTTGNNDSGGAVYAYYADLHLDHALVTGNSTAGDLANGGGLSVYGGNATLTDSTISGNSTVGDFSPGGGLYVFDGNATLTDSTVSGNSTEGINARGGGLSVRFGNATLTDSTISDNSTAGDLAFGGGLDVQFGYATLSDSTISDNSTAGFAAFGGGLFVGYSNPTLTNSTVSGNSTTGNDARGGGLFVIGSNATLTNSTVSGNSVGGYGTNGGGLYVDSGNATLTHATVAFNTAFDGTDGVHRVAEGDLTLNNSLVVQAGVGETACNAAAAPAVNSLATDASCTGTATDLAEIALGPLADNGGPTLTHALDISSVAIDAAGDCDITQDQRGAPRPGAGSDDCDIGAYEIQGEPEIDLAPELLDFGEVVVDQTSAAQTVTLENTGTSVLNLGELTFSGAHAGDFALANDFCSDETIEPAANCTFEVTFTPSATGARESQVDIPSDAPSSPDAVALTGEGVEEVDEAEPLAIPVMSRIGLGLMGGMLLLLGWLGLRRSVQAG